MIQVAIDRAYASPSAESESLAKGRRLAFAAIVVCALVTGLILMPLLYAAAVPEGMTRALSGRSGAHLLINGAANTLVMIWALTKVGRYDRKLAGVLSTTLVVHGCIAFAVLIGRFYHSNQVMLMSMGASCFLGVVTMSIAHRLTVARVAILGSDRGVQERTGVRPIEVTDPAADLSSFDLILTDGVTDLQPVWASALSRAMLTGKPVRLVEEFVEERRGQVSLEHFDYEHIPASGLTSYRTRKRLLDLALILVSLPIVLPLLVVGAGVVLISMGRPVFFVQSRIGLGGEPFQMYKLRTMTTGSERGVPSATQAGADKRVTPAGKWLRRFRIDELPQLWNVLRGDMSIVGPRPEWTMLGEAYVRQLPVYAYRHLVRPGITGWAQVKGGYASDLAETRAKVGYDLFYIKNLSFSLDVQILARTIWTLLTGYGAR